MIQMQRGWNGGNPKNRSHTGNWTLSYCWTHGLSDNLADSGDTCKNKIEGHVDIVTWKNKMGGSDKDCSKI